MIKAAVISQTYAGKRASSRGEKWRSTFKREIRQEGKVSGGVRKRRTNAILSPTLAGQIRVSMGDVEKPLVGTQCRLTAGSHTTTRRN